MTRNFSDTELVFGDLRQTAEDLHKEHGSPVRVRRLLSQFISLSQQLTEVMRKEHSDVNGSKWQAESFPDWSKVTNLFKKMRRTDYHSYPVTIRVEEIQYFAVGDIFEDGIGTSEVAVQGTWDLGDPFSEHVPEGLQLILADPATGKPSHKFIEPKRRNYVFRLTARTQDLEQVERTAAPLIRSMRSGNSCTVYALPRLPAAVAVRCRWHKRPGYADAYRTEIWPLSFFLLRG